MKNILSYHNGIFSGAEIMEWANYHDQNNTSHKKHAHHVLRVYSKINPNRDYIVHWYFDGIGCNKRIRKFQKVMLTRVR